MIRAMDLIEVLSDRTYKANYANAKATGTCIKCKKPAKNYRTPLAKLE